MKKNLVCRLLFLFPAALMVRAGASSVNIPANTPSLTAPTTSAEGDPMPGPGGPHASSLLAAEGDPMPGPGGPHAATRA